MQTECAPGTQILLPFAEKEYVSMNRAMKILGLKWTAVYRLCEEKPPRLELIDYGFSRNKRVRYASIVKLCDDLRVQFNIKDRRPALSAPYLRHRDEDLLPFPLADTAGAIEVMEALGYSGRPGLFYLLRSLVATGKIDAYQISPGSPWRISRSSALRYAEASRKGRTVRP